MASSPAVARKPRPITISEEGGHELEKLVRSPSTAAGLSRRARAVLLMSQGVRGAEVARRCVYTSLSHTSIHRIWKAHDFKPAPARDVQVHHRPSGRRAHQRCRRAVLESPDQCSRAQFRREDADPSPRAHPAAAAGPAWTLRSPDSRLPPRRGHKLVCRSRGQDRPRHRPCRPSANGSEFLDFLKTLSARFRGKQLHVILDNCSTHSTPAVQKWLAENPRVQLHFTRKAPPGSI